MLSNRGDAPAALRSERMKARPARVKKRRLRRSRPPASRSPPLPCRGHLCSIQSVPSFFLWSSPMAEITAKLVNDLRAKTGQGMMECKKMLTEAGGDLDRAVDLFRKKGVKASLAERAASEGRVFGAKSADGKSAALVEINCNTDFTARSEPVQHLGSKAANLLLQNSN